MTYIEHLRAGRVDKIMSAVRKLSSKFLATMAGWELSAVQAQEGTELMAEFESTVEGHLSDLLRDRDAAAMDNMYERMQDAELRADEAESKVNTLERRVAWLRDRREQLLTLTSQLREQKGDLARETWEAKKRLQELRDTDLVKAYEKAMAELKVKRERDEEEERKIKVLREMVEAYKNGEVADEIRQANDELHKQCDELRREIDQYVDALGTRIAVSHEVEEYVPIYGPQEETMADRRAEAIYRILDTLTSREREVLRLTFFEGFTLKETGDVFGVSQERSRQIECKAIRKLRHPSRYKKLIEFYDMDLPSRAAGGVTKLPERDPTTVLRSELGKRLRKGRKAPTYGTFCQVTGLNPTKAVYYRLRSKMMEERGIDH